MSSSRALDHFESVPPVRSPEPELGDALVGPLSEMAASLERERVVAPARVDELLAVPEAERQRRASEPRFATWGVAEVLTRLASEAAEPARSQGLADLALVIAAGLTRHPEDIVADLTARLWAVRGQARLSQDDLAGARMSLTMAAECLARGAGDLLTEAALLELEARVRETEGRRREAASLLRQAASRYSEIGNRAGQARVRAWRDRLLAEAERDRR